MGDFNEEYDVVIVGTGELWATLVCHLEANTLYSNSIGLTECILSGYDNFLSASFTAICLSPNY